MSAMISGPISSSRTLGMDIVEKAQRSSKVQHSEKNTQQPKSWSRHQAVANDSTSVYSTSSTAGLLWHKLHSSPAKESSKSRVDRQQQVLRSQIKFNL